MGALGIFTAARRTSSRWAGGIPPPPLLPLAAPRRSLHALRMRWLPRDPPQRDHIVCPDTEDMRGPSIKCLCALAGEVMPLINGGDTEKLRWLMGEYLVHHDGIKGEPSQRRDT